MPHNLQNGLVVNSCYATPKARRVLIILLNITDQNIWLRQPLLATALSEVELEPQQYCVDMSHEGDEVIMSFHPAIPHKGKEPVRSNMVEVEQNYMEPKEDTSSVDYPKYMERPNTGKDLKRKLQLPFKFNLGGAPFTREQQDQILNLVYDNQQVFSLHDDDLGFCDKITRTIPTITDKPVYFPHYTILCHLQGEVCKCLDTR